MSGPDLVRRSSARQPRAVASLQWPRTTGIRQRAGPAGPDHKLKAALHRLLTLGTGTAAHEQALSLAVSQRPAEPWVVAFVAGKGGIGTTSAAAGTALTLASLLPGDVALADTRTGTASLGERVGEGPVADAAAFTTGVVPLVRQTGVTVVDGAPWDTPLARPTLARLVLDLREDHLLTVLDVGDDATDIGQGALSRADRVVVVTTLAADAVAAAKRTLERLYAISPTRAAEAVVVVVTGARRLGHKGRRRHAYEFGVEQLLHLPWDPMLDGGLPIEMEKLRRVTRAAYLQLAAAVCARDREEPQ